MTLGLTVAWRVMRTSPWVLSIIILAPSFVGGLLVLSPNFHELWQVLNLLIIAIQVGWIWSVYTVSVAATPGQQRPGWISWIFASPPLINAIAVIAGLSLHNSPAASLFFAAFLFCIGRTAVELETADRSSTPAGIGRTLGTAALLFFAPVGVWWLRPRLLRLADRIAIA